MHFEDDFPVLPALQDVLRSLRIDANQIAQLATDGFEEYAEAEVVELSVLLCSDDYIRQLNKEWLGHDYATDVLSFPQHQPAGMNPTHLLGDIVISVETAQKQADERGHSLLDELRILLVHGVLHLIGFDHEAGAEQEQEMAEEEIRIMAALNWKGQGLIEAAKNGSSESQDTAAKAPVRRPLKPFFKYLFCDMDGTLLNSDSKISPSTADALKAAKERGVTIVIATGKARPAAMAALSAVGLTGENGIVTLSSPGVFLQGLRVYGREGAVVHNALLPEDVCREGFAYAAKYNTALIGFSGDKCVTLFDHPLVEKLHTTFYEPRAIVMNDIEHLIAEAPIQKLLFYDTPHGIESRIRPHWSYAVGGRATITQAVHDMLEVLPHGASKGAGVQILLDHLNVPANEIMAIGDGENDLEMIAMAGFGVAMENGSPKTKAVANALVGSNDNDGVAEAIHKYILI